MAITNFSSIVDSILYGQVAKGIKDTKGEVEKTKSATQDVATLVAGNNPQALTSNAPKGRSVLDVYRQYAGMSSEDPVLSASVNINDVYSNALNKAYLSGNMLAVERIKKMGNRLTKEQYDKAFQEEEIN
jgi:hypothetical protein